MANINIDSDIQYYTSPLEEKIDELEIDTGHLEKRIDELEDKLKSQMIDVDDECMGLQDKLVLRKLEIECLNDKLDDVLKLLKTIGD